MKRDHTLHELLIPFLAQKLGVGCYVELGSHQNATLAAVRQAIPTGRVIGVDCIEPRQRVPNVEYHITTTGIFLAEIAPTIALAADMVFVDADHASGAVWSDLMGIWPYLRPEGLVLLHDTNPESDADTAPGFCNDAWRTALRAQREGYEGVTLPYHPGLTLIRKRERWGPLLVPGG